MSIFVVYLGIFSPLFMGASVALLGGLFMDTFAGSPLGLFIFTYLGIFFLIKFLAKFLIWFQNHRFLRKIEGRQDFIGLNYYFHKKFGDKKRYEKSDLGWDIYPKGIYNVLMGLKRYRKPIYITENGIADAKDTKRAKFIKNHLYWVSRAINDNINVRGYFYWSLLDNFEWADGFEPKFGLVEVDYKTMERRIRPSAYEYKKICDSNSLND